MYVFISFAVRARSQIELNPVRRLTADANLKRYQHSAQGTLNTGELRVTQSIAIVMAF